MASGAIARGARARGAMAREAMARGSKSDGRGRCDNALPLIVFTTGCVSIVVKTISTTEVF